MEQHESRLWAASCDPFELVEVAREGIHQIREQGTLKDLPEDKRYKIVAATDQLVSRFEQAQRASLGTQVGGGVSSPSS